MKLALLHIIILILPFTTVLSQDFGSNKPAPSPETLKLVKEEFHYEVHYGPIRLGFVDVEPIRDTLYKGKPSLIYKVIMRSNPNLWIIGNKREHFYSIFTPYKDKSYGLAFWSDDIDSKVMQEIKIDTDYSDGKVFIERRFKKDPTIFKELPLEPFALLGPDIYFFSRFFVGKDTVIQSPIYVDTTLESVKLKYISKPQNRKYLAFKDSISTFRMIGDAKFKGPFGFNGDFFAWFGTDSLRIPLEAHADVWIGFVKVSLIDYKRHDHE